MGRRGESGFELEYYLMYALLLLAECACGCLYPVTVG